MRRFEVVHPVAGYVTGDVIDEEHLEGCNVDALVEGGFLQDTAAATPSASDIPPPSEPTTGG